MNNSSHHAIFRAIRSLGRGSFREYINQNCITAQANECFVPWLPHPRPGQRGVVLLAMHEPSQRLPPSLPLQLPSHGTSTNVPSIASRPCGKKAVPVPESWHRSKLRFISFSAYHGSNWKARTHCMDIPNWLRGWETVWPHHSSLTGPGHKLSTLTTMLLNGPGNDGVYGSSFEVILKQRPQASPEAELAPNASVLVAAV
jgi:hypothetical protein